MSLSTSYLGLRLSTPLVVGASPFADSVPLAQSLEDFGAGAIVMRSLFEEQIYLAALAAAPTPRPGFPAQPDLVRSFPPPAEYQLSPERYLAQIRALKAELAIPVIASLNGCRPGGWLDYAAQFEKAGADAIEINLYQVAADGAVSALEVEAEMLEAVRLARASIKIPLAVKISPFLTSPLNFCRQLEKVGADGVVLFNRFYQAGIDLEEERDELKLELSEPSELLLRLRWISLLAPNFQGTIVASGGIHGGKDAIKAIASGAHAVQVVSVLLRHGPRVLATLLAGVSQWMSAHGYAGVSDLRGTQSRKGLDPAGEERADYQRLLQAWRV